MWAHKGWVGRLFPARTPASAFLRLYSRRLTCVEGNTTFYSLPSSETVRHWAQETPASFRFCPKVSRSISHEADLGGRKLETQVFVERMRGLGERLGPVFLQLPPTFGPASLPQLQTFLDFWPADMRLAVEVRHPDFYSERAAELLNSLLSQYQVARVVMDSRPIRTGPVLEQQMLQARERKPDLPLQIATTSDFVFVRYIGHPRMEVNEPFFEQWAQQLARWFKQGLTLYIFCHCAPEDHSPAICQALYQRVRALAPLPPLSWQSEAKDDARLEQGRLF
jgi:uncharacterized protein YecE (DUF72 family)